MISPKRNWQPAVPGQILGDAAVPVEQPKMVINPVREQQRILGDAVSN
jgi:hypothetical protein